LDDETLNVGDYLLIHVGYAIQKISEEEALSTWELLDQMLAEDTESALSS
jgi:hydrogenase expression/formation protein HypC